MKKNVTAFFCGTLFALGLGISQMANPSVIIGFLNLKGTWNPTLAIVFATAVSFYSFAYWLIGNGEVRDNFEKILRPKEILSKRVVIGALLFGMGWGLVGFCPGPAIVNLATGNWQIYPFAAAMFAGIAFVKWMNRP